MECNNSCHQVTILIIKCLIFIFSLNNVFALQFTSDNSVIKFEKSNENMIEKLKN